MYLERCRYRIYQINTFLKNCLLSAMEDPEGKAGQEVPAKISKCSAFLFFYCRPGREIASHWSDLETCLAAKIPGRQKLSPPREKQDLLCLLMSSSCRMC